MITVLTRAFIALLRVDLGATRLDSSEIRETGAAKISLS
jgi:hypothetical protein